MHKHYLCLGCNPDRATTPAIACRDARDQRAVGAASHVSISGMVAQCRIRIACRKRAVDFLARVDEAVAVRLG